MQDLQVGDVVRLANGPGPWMTIEKVDGDHVRGVWFNNDAGGVGKPRASRATYSVAVLAFGWRDPPARLGGLAGGATT